MDKEGVKDSSRAPSLQGNGDFKMSSSNHEVSKSALHLEDQAPDDVVSVDSETRKAISPMTMLALCFNICSSWAGFLTSIQIALLQGGPMTLIYGIMVTAAIYLCIGTLLAELASVYPTAGGQYHFTSILAPARINRLISYICGFITTFYWIATNASVSIIIALQIEALATWYNPDIPGAAWQIFLVYEALALLAALSNIFMFRLLTICHNIGFALSLTLLLITFVGLLTRARTKAPSAFVWSTFVNSTGWPDGICFLTGLLTPFFAFCGLDGALHLAEEAQQPRRVVPRVCFGVVVIGFLTAFPCAIAIIYSITDFDALLQNTGWIPFEINRHGFRSDDAALVLLYAGVILGFLILNAATHGSSRVVWAFSRDKGFAFSGTLSQIHPRLGVPVWSILLNWALVASCGLLILASSVAFGAIISSTVVHQLVSYFIPFVLLLYRRRSNLYLPVDREFCAPGWVGWGANILVVMVIPVLVVAFILPPFRPVTLANMNWTIVVLGIVTFLGSTNWLFYARKHYQGPRIEVRS